MSVHDLMSSALNSLAHMHAYAHAHTHTHTATPVSELYFSNQQDIMRLLTDGSSTIVISDPKLVDAIDCNICDRMIYWVDQPGVIKRADPFNHSSVQVVSRKPSIYTLTKIDKCSTCAAHKQQQVLHACKGVLCVG